MVPAINLGPFVLPTAPFLYIIGAWLCLSLAETVGAMAQSRPGNDVRAGCYWADRWHNWSKAHIRSPILVSLSEQSTRDHMAD